MINYEDLTLGQVEQYPNMIFICDGDTQQVILKGAWEW